MQKRLFIIILLGRFTILHGVVKMWWKEIPSQQSDGSILSQCLSWTTSLIIYMSHQTSQVGSLRVRPMGS